MAIGTFTSDPNGDRDVYGVKGFTTLSYEGAVLETRERNGYDDSDFYARVWDEETGTVKDVEYATTRGWTYGNYAEVDATDEVKAKANAFYAKLALEALKDKAATAARTPAVGKTVKVVKGRKVPLGTVGEVFFYGEGAYFGPRPQFRSGAWSTKGAMRVGLKTPTGARFFTAASNVEVLDPEEYLPALEDLERQATYSGAARYALSAAAAHGMVYL